MILRISVSSLEKSGQTPPMTGFSSCAQHIVLIRAMLSHPVPGGKTTAMEQFLSRKREVQELGRPQGPDTAALSRIQSYIHWLASVRKQDWEQKGGSVTRPVV